MYVYYLLKFLKIYGEKSGHFIKIYNYLFVVLFSIVREKKRIQYKNNTCIIAR